MQIVEVAINEIKEYENNPRINDKAIEAVQESIASFGFKVPIVLDKNNVIIAGHTRLSAAQRLGLETVPCIIADDLTPEKVKAYRLTDNKTAELAEWDFEKLEQELSELTAFDMSVYGFDENEFTHIDDLFNDDEISFDMGAEKETFNITFVFPIEQREKIDGYVKRNGKDFIVNMIIERAAAECQ